MLWLRLSINQASFSEVAIEGETLEGLEDVIGKIGGRTGLQGEGGDGAASVGQDDSGPEGVSAEALRLAGFSNNSKSATTAASETTSIFGVTIPAMKSTC